MVKINIVLPPEWKKKYLVRSYIFETFSAIAYFIPILPSSTSRKSIIDRRISLGSERMLASWIACKAAYLVFSAPYIKLLSHKYINWKLQQTHFHILKLQLCEFGIIFPIECDTTHNFVLIDRLPLMKVYVSWNKIKKNNAHWKPVLHVRTTI